MSIEDVADRADVWSDAIKKIVKAVTAAVVACVAAVSAVLMMWPSDAKVGLGHRVRLGARVRVVGAELGFKSGFRSG